VAINSTDGSTKWQVKLSDGVWSAPVSLEDRLYVGDQSGKINIINSADGSLVQSIDVQSAILGNGALMNDDIVFGDEKGEIIVIGKNGERLWTRSLTGKLYSNLLFTDNHLYVLTTKGDKPLYTYDSNGNEIWNYSTSK
jgi:outer membrane protein assembly factor BamB